MFGDIGWGEIAVILVIVLIVFGPDKLPKLASDLAKTIRAARNWAQKAKNDLADEMGPEFRDLDLTALHPKTFVRKALLEDDDPLGLDRATNGSGNGNGSTSASNGSRADTATLPADKQAPYDAEAT